MAETRIFACILIFAKILTLTTGQSLKFQEEIVESINEKLQTHLEESNKILTNTLKDLKASFWKKIDDENEFIRRDLAILKQDLLEQSIILNEVRETIKGERSSLGRGIGGGVGVGSGSGSFESTITRRLNNNENSLKEVKQLLEGHIRMTSDDSNAVFQDLAFMKLKLNEFKEVLTEVNNIDNSLTKLKKDHSDQNESFREIKKLVRENGNSVSNVSVAIKQQFKNFARHLTTTANLSNCSSVIGKKGGIYRITLNDSDLTPFDAYCEPDGGVGGAWTVILRRVDNSTDFYWNMEKYKEGFGDLTGNFFIGLDKLHALTKTPHEMWISMEDFEGEKRIANYSRFAIAGEEDNYKITELKDFKGDGGDSLLIHKGQGFSTYDVDNDNAEGNCASYYRAAWWYKGCHDSQLTGEYLYGKHDQTGHGIIWHKWHGNKYSLKYAQMAIRPTTK